METATKTGTTSDRTVGATALSLAGTALNLGERALQAKFAVTNTIEDGKRAAQQAVRKGRFAAEDAIAQTTLQVRRRPLSSIASAFACGVLSGGAMLYVIGQVRRRA